MADRPLSSAVLAAPKWTELNDLSSSSVGGEVLFSTDDWFAAAERLLETKPAEWREGFTQQGKWMDGWETRRKRIPGHDWCLIKLGLPGKISGIELDTSFFTGNFTPRASVQAIWLEEPPTSSFLYTRKGGAGHAATANQINAADKLKTDMWPVIVPMSDLGAGYKDTARSFFTVDSPGPYNYIRLNMFPDGGIARLRTYGVAVPQSQPPLCTKLDLVSAAMGGVCVGYSDAHYGHPKNMIHAGRGVDMGDGWETARRLDRPPVLKLIVKGDPNGVLKVPGYEWAAFKLGLSGRITDIEVDTNHFKGNFPDSVTIEGANLNCNERDNMDEILGSQSKAIWKTVLPRKKLSAHAQHLFPEGDMTADGVFTHVRVSMFPDGGISRIRIMGYWQKAGLAQRCPSLQPLYSEE